MIDTERREQILKAEAAIRQLAEKMAENLAARKTAEDATSALQRGIQSVNEASRTLNAAAGQTGEARKAFAEETSAFRRGTESLNEANRTLVAFSKEAGEIQKAVLDAQKQYHSTSALAREEAASAFQRGIDAVNEANRILSGSAALAHDARNVLVAAQEECRTSAVAAEEAASAFRRGNESLDEARRTLAATAKQAGEAQKAFTDAQEDWATLSGCLEKASIEGAEAIRTCSLNIVSALQESQEKYAASTAAMLSEINSGHETLNRNCKLLMDGILDRHRAYEEHGRNQIAALEAQQKILARRITIGNALNAAFLIAILAMLA